MELIFQETCTFVLLDNIYVWKIIQVKRDEHEYLILETYKIKK